MKKIIVITVALIILFGGSILLGRILFYPPTKKEIKEILKIVEEEKRPKPHEMKLYKIPDTTFRKVLQYIIPKAFKAYYLDVNHPHVKFVETLNVSNLDIHSLAGIEYFTELRSLSCNRNNLTSLDVSKNSKLWYLSCWGNDDLTKLVLPPNRNKEKFLLSK